MAQAVTAGHKKYLNNYQRPFHLIADKCYSDAADCYVPSEKRLSQAFTGTIQPMRDGAKAAAYAIWSVFKKPDEADLQF